MGGAVRAGLRRTELLRVVEAAKAGDKQATNELISYCLPQVESYVANRGAAHPEALANLVMAEFVRSLGRLEFRSPGQVWSYIYQVSRSRLVDERRKVKLETATDAIEGVDGRSSDFDNHVVDEMWVTDLLSGLTEDQRQVVELRFKDDLTLEETARRVGKTLTAVKGLQRRALATLAAVAAIIAIIWTVDAADVRVLSADPAESNNSTPAPGPSGLGPSAIDRARAMTDGNASSLYAATIEANPPVVTQDTAGTPMSGPGGPTGGEPGPASSTTTVPENATSTTVPSTVPAENPVADVPTTTIPPSGSDGSNGADGPSGETGTVPTVPPETVPAVAVNDVASIAYIPRTLISIDIDVLANDVEPYYPLSLRVVSHPQNGFVDLISGGERPVIRFYPDAAGDSFFEYEVCSPTGCHKAVVNTSTYWYGDPCRGLVPTIVGTAGNDLLTGTTGPDIIFGLGGDDVIVGGDGDDIICGGEGHDTISGDPGSDILSGGPGEDDIRGGKGDDLIFGGQGVDFLDGNNGSDYLYGGDDADDISGGMERDIIYGEAGNDVINGNDRSDLLFGGIGNDRLIGEGSSDLMHGGLGSDYLQTGPGLDRIVDVEPHDRLLVDAEDSIEGWVGPEGCNLNFGVETVCRP
jgi:RNA polymerase sigma factor (sigma-70 family)